jgi:hypothetical protein
MGTVITTDMLAIITLCFTIGLAKRNLVINHDKNRVYIAAALITIIILLLTAFYDGTRLMSLSTTAARTILAQMHRT